MLNISIYEDFISVGAQKGISKYAHAIMPDRNFEDGMSGYEIEDFIKHIVLGNQFVKDQTASVYSDILKSFDFDSEYSMFCMYYKITGNVTDEHIRKCHELVSIINNLIRNEYVNAITKIDTKVEVFDCRKREYLIQK